MKILNGPGLALLLSIVLAVPVLPMGWRGSPEPNLNAIAELPYDNRNEVPFEGKITRIDPDPCVALPISSYHIHINVGNEVIEVHLGPCWYMANQKPALQEGDTITGIGSQLPGKPGDRRTIAAREIHRGKETIRLRDTTGKALWR